MVKMDDEMESIWLDASVPYFKVLSRYFSWLNEENHENSSQDSRYPGLPITTLAC
jgi:hypothetical protein